jgi:hypothetical protein
MQIRKKVWTAFFGLWAGLSGAVFAADVPVTVTPASGLPGSTVKPGFSLAVNGIDFVTLDLTLTFSNALLSFDLGSSTISYNGQSKLWSSLPGFITPPGPLTAGTFLFGSLDLNSVNIIGPLVLEPAFQVRNGAPLGDTTVTVSGSICCDPVFEERYFDSSAAITVSAVPEPEVWLLWLGGVGLLAWRRLRLQR